jgi:hypothetical protein
MSIDAISAWSGIDREKEYKKMEMVGKKFREEAGETTMLLELDRGFTKNNIKLANELADCMPVIYARFEKMIEEDYQDWLEQYEASADPPMDKFHYLRPQL